MANKSNTEVGKGKPPSIPLYFINTQILQVPSKLGKHKPNKPIEIPEIFSGIQKFKPIF